MSEKNTPFEETGDDRGGPQLADFMPAAQDGFVARAGRPLPAGQEPASEIAIIDALMTVKDPEIPVNIYDLGLIYSIDRQPGGEVAITMSLTAPGCPVAGEMPGWIQEAVAPVAGVKDVDVEITWDPPWGMDMMSDEARLELGFM